MHVIRRLALQLVIVLALGLAVAPAVAHTGGAEIRADQSDCTTCWGD